jgi:hypothetical protein
MHLPAKCPVPRYSGQAGNSSKNRPERRELDRKKFWAQRFLSVILTVSLASCGVEAPPPSAPEPTRFFPSEDVCSFPLSGPGLLFSKLGGGVWSPTDLSDKNSSYECAGSLPEVHLYGDQLSNVRVAYRVTGVDRGGTVITAIYQAEGPTIENESTLRNAFSNLANAIAERAYGTKLPDLARRKIGNL